MGRVARTSQARVPGTSAAQVSAAEITKAVVDSVAATPDRRLGELMTALVRHLHAIATEVQLTQDEWHTAIQILTETGHKTDDKRQEFILWSDVVGLSSIVDVLAHDRPGATESTVLGPFYVPGSPLREYGASIAESDDGDPTLIHGTVRGTDGAAIVGAEIDVWQNGAGGLYAIQDTLGPEYHLRGRFVTKDDGSYAFIGVRPTPYTVPHDGPVGRMLKATGRQPWRPAHIHMIVRAPGYQTLVTHIFDAASDYLDSDAVFAVKRSLLRLFRSRSADDPDRPPGIDRPWFSVVNDIALAPEG